MNSGRSVFAQIMDYLPQYEFAKCVDRYKGDYKVKHLTCLSQFYVMAFAQLTFRESLRDIEACLGSIQGKLYHMGIRGPVRRSTLADANESRDWRIFADFAQVLMRTARPLYADDPIGADLDEVVYALDATTIDLCLALFPWARFRQGKAAVKVHTLLDIHGPLPVFVCITDGTVHELNILDKLIPEAGAVYLLDRGYTDFQRLFRIDQAKAFFVIRAKRDLRCRRIYSAQPDLFSGLHSDQTIALTGQHSSQYYPNHMRRIHYFDQHNRKHLVFLTNNFDLPALLVADVYRCRWQVELFFKWIKQHLRIKAFYGLSENAVKTQIWIAISVYLLIAVIKKEIGLENSLYTILQIISVSLFEKSLLSDLFAGIDFKEPSHDLCNQLNLFQL
jgi:hypothetical protein